MWRSRGARLRLEAAALVDRVSELRESVCELPADDEELEALGDTRQRAVRLRERAHLSRAMKVQSWRI
eukprot:6173300-Pleurochrysis_carterae.AAC.2